MLRIVKKTAVLGARKPLIFSENIAGGCKRLVGVGVFIPAIENQFASDSIATSAQQSMVVNPVGMFRVSMFASSITTTVKITDGSITRTLSKSGYSSKYTLTGTEINTGSRSMYIKVTTQDLMFGTNTTTYYSASDDFSYTGTKSGTLVQTNEIANVTPFMITLKRSDTLTFDIITGTIEISRDLPIFSEFNGITVKMQINNLQDNPLCFIFNPKITMPFTPVATTTEQSMAQMKKALFFNVFEQNRLIQMNYDIHRHTKLDFIVDINSGNSINSDYIGESCDLKVYLKYE